MAPALSLPARESKTAALAAAYVVMVFLAIVQRLTLAPWQLGRAKNRS